VAYYGLNAYSMPLRWTNYLMRGDYLKKSKGIYKLSIALMVLLMLITFFLPSNAYSSKSGADIEMEVKAGYDGVARLGTYIPFRILVINKGRAVEGEIQIEVKIDSQSKTILSKPVSLPEGATKEVVISAPVLTARRGVNVSFLEKGKTLKKTEYTFTKLIPPDIKVIGVLSSDNAAYSFLNGALIPQAENAAYGEKIKIMQAAGIAMASTIEAKAGRTLSKVESILIPLTGETFPEDIKALVGFDILIISNFDTGTLSEGQLNVLEKWVEDGGTLVIGTGASWQKVYNSLPEALKKFSVTGTTSVNPPEDLTEFAGAGFSGNKKLDIVTGDIGFEYIKEEVVNEDNKNNENEEENSELEGQKELQNIYSANIDEVITGDQENPLAVKYIHNSGRILFLAFDPAMEPVVSWSGKQAFWENILFHSSNVRRVFEDMPGYYLSNYSESYYFDDLTGQVPEDRNPPFLFMFVTIIVYIIIVGPVMYIFLKKKDKRDFSWIAIPAAALICLFVIYLVGFKTRYRTAVLNTASMIHLDMENQRTDITTGMGIFNNKRGNLKLTYSEKDNIDFNIAQSSSRNYVVYADGKEPDGKVVSKLVLAEPINYELYNVSMWESKNLTAKRREIFQDKIVSSMKISDGKIRVVINNTTKYDFMDAFISIGSNFIDAGDILSGEEKVIEADLNSENVYKSFDAYLDAKYGRTSYTSNTKPPADFKEKRRKRLAVERLLEPQYANIRGETKIGLYALNYQDLGFDIKINGEEPVKYFTNGIFSSMDLNFEKGQEFDIPAGIILPEMLEYGLEQDVASYDGDNGVRIRNPGDIDFTYTIPENLQITEFSIKFDTYIPLYVKYNIEDMQARGNSVQLKILQNKYEYYLYNRTSDSWEQIDNTHTQTGNIGQYIDEENKLIVRVKVVEMADAKSGSPNEYTELERLSYPALQLKGVAR